jgi:transcriptional regulator with XRE-family HTH domain
MLLNSTAENDFAERLRLWRKGVLEMSQEQFAEATGVHLSAIRKYEKRHSVPSTESLLAIARTGVDIHWLLTGEGDMRAPATGPDSKAKTAADAKLVSRLMAIEILISSIQDDKRSAVLDEIFYRVQEAKRVTDLEDLVKSLKRKSR